VNRAVMDVATAGMAGFEFLRGLFVPKGAAATAAAWPADASALEPGAAQSVAAGAGQHDGVAHG